MIASLVAIIVGGLLIWLRIGAIGLSHRTSKPSQRRARRAEGAPKWWEARR